MVMLGTIPPKMAAPFALASALCHLATLAVLMQTRIEPSAVWGAAAGTHRSLLQFAPVSLASSMMQP